jgi:ADP-ribosylglycohydrolase
MMPWQFRLTPAAEQALVDDVLKFWFGWFVPVRRGPSRDRVLGSLIGLCLGDALGFVVEGHALPICQEYVEDILRPGMAGTVGRSPHRFGQYSDDSQLTRELMRSVVACQGFEPGDYARRIAALFAEQRVVGRGVATAAAASRLSRGVPWRLAGTPAPHAGNGAAMRAAPIGWLFHDDETRLVLAARDQALITHGDPRAVAGSVVVAAAVADGLRSGSATDPDRLIDQLARLADGLDASFAAALRQMHDWRHRDPESARWLIARAGKSRAELQICRERPWPTEEDSISAFVIPSVLWSLYAVLRTPDDYWQTLCTAIAGGGDTDTTAAMAGAISGARLGQSAIPQNLAASLTDCEEWGYEALVDLADRFRTVTSPRPHRTMH